jgi:uncharacterized protein YbjT (DUF2867 family)
MDVVTGAFGYIGRYIAAHLLEQGRAVKTVTTHIDRPSPFGDRVQASPYNFDRPEQLVESLRGAETLYNTYWIRFEHGGLTFDQAVANTRTLFRCAAQAGVGKIVHISVTQPSADSPLPYYRGKAQQEAALAESGLPYAIVRPTLVFGREDILVNNIAWLLRKFPFLPIFGDGRYRVQPVYVGDVAAIAASAAADDGPLIRDAIGPETYTYRELVETIAAAVGRRPRLVSVPPALGIFLGRIVGLFVRDVILTRDEAQGLMANLLTSEQPPNGPTRFSNWLEANGAALGTSYTSELARHFPR